MNPTPESDEKTSKPPAFQLIWKLLKEERVRYSLATLSLLAATLIEFLVPLVGSATIDYVLDPDYEKSNPLLERLMTTLGGADNVAANLWIPALAMFLFAVCSGIFNHFQKRLAARASDGICKRAKDRLYDHIQKLSNRYLDGAQTGDLVQRCTSDIETMRLFLAAHVVEIGRSIILIAAVIPVMLALNPLLTLISTFLIPIIILFGYFYFKKVKAVFKEVDEAEGRLTSVVQENITGIRVVRAFGRHHFEIEKFAQPNQEYRDMSIRLTGLMARFWAPSDMLSLTQIGLALVVGSYMAAKGTTTVGTLFAFLALLNLVLWPVRMIGRILTDLGKTVVSISRIDEILSEPTETCKDEIRAHPPKPVLGQIEIQDVSFRHSSESQTIDQVSVSINRGETLAILGPSGSGKSTLLHLLLRFYDCDEGSILLDGMDIRDLDRQYLRRQFGVVLQEPFLYSRSIEENIRFGGEISEMNEVISAAKLASIHETIVGFADGYNTEIGERGITLSGGQRQRVALSRALLSDPPILLLDDALSAVDNDTEKAVIEALESRRKNRTTIIIAHRLSTLAHADRVIVMEKGRITQTGTHDTLIEKPGLYQRLWNIQTEMQTALETAK